MTTAEAIAILTHERDNDIFCGTDYRKKVHEAQTMAIQALEQTRWIPVTEYEPKEYGEFMITWIADEVNKPLIGFAEYDITGEYDHEKNKFKGEWLFEDYVKAYTNPKVTAWMPLPNPYNGGE